MLLTRDDGVVARTPEEADQAHLAGHMQCATYLPATKANPVARYCNFFMSPEAQHTVEKEGGGYYTCPVCRQSNDLWHELPWHGLTPDQMEENALAAEQAAHENPNRNFKAGGITRIGIPLDVQGQIGEDLIERMGEIPSYGPITWFHQGGASTNSPLDAMTKDWGVEIKTIGYDASHHRFIPGRTNNKGDKDRAAQKAGKLGVLGVLILLDYRRSVADIFVREMPLPRGTLAWRSHQGQHLVKEVPFRNPLMDPHDPTPSVETPF